MWSLFFAFAPFSILSLTEQQEEDKLWITEQERFPVQWSHTSSLF